MKRSITPIGDAKKAKEKAVQAVIRAARTLIRAEEQLRRARRASRKKAALPAKEDRP